MPPTAGIKEAGLRTTGEAKQLVGRKALTTPAEGDGCITAALAMPKAPRNASLMQPRRWAAIALPASHMLGRIE